MPEGIAESEARINTVKKRVGDAPLQSPAHTVVFRIRPSRAAKTVIANPHGPETLTIPRFVHANPAFTASKSVRGKITHRAVLTTPFFCERRPGAPYLPARRSEEPFIPGP
jgi:hypothetical protein